jgi:hypothetical protein
MVDCPPPWITNGGMAAFRTFFGAYWQRNESESTLIPMGEEAVTGFIEIERVMVTTQMIFNATPFAPYSASYCVNLRCSTISSSNDVVVFLACCTYARMNGVLLLVVLSWLGWNFPSFWICLVSRWRDTMPEEEEKSGCCSKVPSTCRTTSSGS